MGFGVDFDQIVMAGQRPAVDRADAQAVEREFIVVGVGQRFQQGITVVGQSIRHLTLSDGADDPIRRDPMHDENHAQRGDQAAAQALAQRHHGRLPNT
ncbi:hypothetical protein [Methylomonas sp. CM2]|uniref:hypothetical protein n=1 Tax=Methylomonas sp. CM2 TaxID=3417647 RepID=UPI003CEC5353